MKDSSQPNYNYKKLRGAAPNGALERRPFRLLPNDTHRFKLIAATIAGTLIGISLILGVLYFLGPIKLPDVTERKTPANLFSVSKSNKDHAKVALDAIGEINSVASVGANYIQYTGAVQAARIKFDSALRSFDSTTPEDERFIAAMEDDFQCYTDAATAWNEFVQNGNEFGFMNPKSYSRLPSLESKYDFTKDAQGRYFREEVIGHMLQSGAAKFADLNKALRSS
ncbi:MAG: hypothetical protein JO053_15295 [Acidobacteria bacterium]|nr:hypothetical protein [Acidobacteriota bacterium]